MLTRGIPVDGVHTPRILVLIAFVLLILEPSARAGDVKSLAMTPQALLSLGKLAQAATGGKALPSGTGPSWVRLRDAFQQALTEEMESCRIEIPGPTAINARARLASLGNISGVADSGVNFAYLVSSAEWESWGKKHKRSDGKGGFEGLFVDVEGALAEGKIGKIEIDPLLGIGSALRGLGSLFGKQKATPPPGDSSKLFLIYAKQPTSGTAPPNALTEAQATCLASLFRVPALLRIGTRANALAAVPISTTLESQESAVSH